MQLRRKVWVFFAFEEEKKKSSATLKQEILNSGNWLVFRRILTLKKVKLLAAE